MSLRVPLLILVFLLCASWYLPGVIGLRYTVGALLLLVMILLSTRAQLVGFYSLWIYGSFLALLAFYDADTLLTLENIRKEWGKNFLFALLGFLLAISPLQSGGGSSSLFRVAGMGFMVPMGVYAAFLGNAIFATSALPIGSWGIQLHHQELAFASLLGFFLFALSLKYTFANLTILISVGVTIAYLLFVAQSRAGFLFFMVMLCILTIWFSKNIRWYLCPNNLRVSTTIVLLSILAATVAIWLSLESGTRFDALRNPFWVAFYADSILTICRGTDYFIEAVTKSGVGVDSSRAFLQSVNGGDLSRIVTATAGINLMIDHPLGLHGAREAYQYAVISVCNPPAIAMSHTHNAWVDTGLALGIPGLAVVVFFWWVLFMTGYAATKSPDKEIRKVGFACALFAVIVFIRGMVDSSMRDQMAESQFFICGLLFGALAQMGHHAWGSTFVARVLSDIGKTFPRSYRKQ
jgi:hypothetical protein